MLCLKLLAQTNYVAFLATLVWLSTIVISVNPMPFVDICAELEAALNAGGIGRGEEEVEAALNGAGGGV
jgi:hypothetical protein